MDHLSSALPSSEKTSTLVAHWHPHIQIPLARRHDQRNNFRIKVLKCHHLKQNPIVFSYISDVNCGRLVLILRLLSLVLVQVLCGYVG